MAGNQKNFKWQLYVDDDGVQWNMRGESGGALAGIDGNAAFDLTKPIWTRKSKLRHPRYAIFMHPTTFRTVKGIVYTPTAFAAIVAATTVTPAVAGVAASPTYNLSQKVPERQPKVKAARNLAEIP